MSQRRRSHRDVRRRRARQERRAQSPGYELVAELHHRGDWNVDPRRFALGERTCPPGHDTLVVETRPQDRRRPDDGVIVVAHVPSQSSVDELVDDYVRATMTVAAMMTKKFGSSGWWPAAITGPGWLLAELDQRVQLPQT